MYGAEVTERYQIRKQCHGNQKKILIHEKNHYCCLRCLGYLLQKTKNSHSMKIRISQVEWTGRKVKPTTVCSKKGRARLIVIRGHDLDERGASMMMLMFQLFIWEEAYHVPVYMLSLKQITEIRMSWKYKVQHTSSIM